MKNFKLGSLNVDPAEYASHGNAILGIRGSGKTYTATLIAERLFDAGIPFIAFDPIGVWRHLRVPGDGKGYPVVVAGGKDGDLPLSVAGVPAIVRAAMQGGVSVVLDLFDMNLSKADWRRIVTAAVRTLMHENHAHGLRHVFIEEAAEFIPQKPIDWDVYAEIEKMARMGGNSRLGYTLINQRSQEVSKAILELCENVFLHRQRGKNALENMDKWLQVAGAAEQKEIIKSLPDLPQGECWAWLGGDTPTPPTHIKVPAKNSAHPDRRVMRGDTTVAHAKPVDVGQFVAGMRGQLEVIVEEAKANDPTALKKRIKELEAEVARKPAPGIDAAALNRAQKEAHADGVEQGIATGYSAGWSDCIQASKRALEALPAPSLVLPRVDAAPPTPGIVHRQEPYRSEPAKFVPSRPIPASVTADGLSRPQQRILDALAWLEWVGSTGVDRVRVAMLADQSPKSSGFRANLSTLSGAGLLTYRSGDGIDLTDAGRQAANKPAGAPTNAELHAAIRSKISGPQWRMLDALIEAHPAAVARDALARASDQSPTSSGFRANLSTLSGLGFVEYRKDSTVAATRILFVE